MGSWDDEEDENMRMIMMGIMRTVRVMGRIRRV